MGLGRVSWEGATGRLVAIAAAGLTAIACGGGGPPDREFPEATAVQVDHVEVFLQDGVSLRHAHAAPASQSRGGHFVAAEVVGLAGLEGYVGVWWHGGTAAEPGMTLAVNSAAVVACVCPDVMDTQATIRDSEDPAPDLRRWVEWQVSQASQRRP